jgi:hypothetical protein
MGLARILSDEKDESTKNESLQHLILSAEELDSIIKSIIKRSEG